MSITITIENNRAYVLRNAHSAIRLTTHTCPCVDFSENGKATPDCPDCHGTGAVTFESYPFELNLANANFRTLFNALGLPDEDYGELDSRIISRAVRKTPAALYQRARREETGERGCHLIDLGIRSDQAKRYQDALLALALEAERREEKIIWG